MQKNDRNSRFVKHLLLFLNKFDKFSKTRAVKVDSVYQMTLKLATLNSKILVCEN